MSKTVAQTICQSRGFTRGTGVGASLKVSLCYQTLNRGVIGAFIASDDIGDWEALKCLGWVEVPKLQLPAP